MHTKVQSENLKGEITWKT